MHDALLYLSLWLNHPRALTGWRSYLVLSRGQQRVWLLATETADSFRITAQEYKRALATQRPIMLFPARTRNRIIAAAQHYKRKDNPAVRFALARLRIFSAKNPNTYDPHP